MNTSSCSSDADSNTAATRPARSESVPNLVGNHFEPIVFVLAPLYWIWSDARALLLAQAVLLALGGIPIFLWARTQLGPAAAFPFQLAYLLFWGVLGGNLYDFHEVA